MFPRLTALLFPFLLMAHPEPARKFDIQGHRGCRGLMPENSIPGFIKAIDLGVTTLEMDVVITKDNQVILSHEPFLSHEICLTPEGQTVTAENERSYNLYQMTYAQVQQCDCGSKPHPRFPQQQKLVVHKPLLSAVIDSVEHYLRQHRLPNVQYNIETKSDPVGDGVFHPAPEAFVQLLMRVIEEKGIASRTIIQSFDVRTLQVLHRTHPKVKLALLVENTDSPQQNLRKLGFVPHIYSPEHPLVNQLLLQYARAEKMKVIPWTANEPEDIQRLLQLGVDGIISDYPDRVIEIVTRR